MEADKPERISHLVDHLFRHESGKMVSVLSRILGMSNLDAVHDIVQDTLLKAMTLWRYGNVPDNPPAWLYTVAKNKAIDFLRAEKTKQRLRGIVETDLEQTALVENMFQERAIHDSQLQMIFACCHPAIPVDSQIALALKTLCGLSTGEIAKAFLTNEDVIAKRIYRAKEKIREKKIEMEAPHANQLQSRLESVLNVLYLLFNEGYYASHADELIRKDICAEAMRLCHLLTQQPITNLPSTNALLALMCFQASRLASRLDDKGNIITLKYQDRTTWNRQLIDRANDYLDRAAHGDVAGIYHLEAGIASLHASSPSFELTDWRSIYHLYEMLYIINPSPMVALNKAIASSYAISHRSALEKLRQIEGLESHNLYHAALGEVCFALDKRSDAKKHFEKALSLTTTLAEKQFLQGKIAMCA